MPATVFMLSIERKLTISFCVDLSYLYSKLVQTYSKGLDDNSSSNTPDESPDTSDNDNEEQALIPKSTHPHFSPGAKKFMAMYVHLVTSS